ncbi:MAG: hypothetical protein HZB57_05845 [Gammaproteobacteria bacterium]|nr:hypothetical protein [Gammaproteobacteria bacterium]
MIDVDNFFKSHEHTARKLRRRESAMLAEALLARHHILAEEQGIAHILFDTNSRSNRATLIKWVDSQHDALCTHDVKERFEILSKALHNIIHGDLH